MTWVAVGSAAVSVVGGYLSSQGAKKGAQAQQRAADANLSEQARQFDTLNQQQQPFLQAGYDALDRQRAALNGDWSGFYSSPDYAFAVDQGMKALERGGNIWGGGADADRIRLGQGLASQNVNNYWNRLAGMAGQGQTSANYLGQAGMNNAATNAGIRNDAANSRASAYAGQANAWTGALNSVWGAGSQWLGSRAGGNQAQTQGWGMPASGYGQPVQQPWYGNNYGNFTYG